jgi:hypothetical protein
MPRESLDAPENLPKERRRQVALRQLQDEVSGMANEPPPVLKSRCCKLGGKQTSALVRSRILLGVAKGILNSKGIKTP